jgi:hypothetical protein
MRVLRYMGGTAAPKRAARWSNRKTISVVVVSVVRQPLKKEASTLSHLLVRVQPHDNSCSGSWQSRDCADAKHCSGPDNLARGSQDELV